MKLHSIAAAVSLTIGMLAMTSTGAIAGSKHKDHENRRNVEKISLKLFLNQVTVLKFMF
ncbi:hypothetical protein [Psychrosphaera algicola]|uniref:Uncharacterized protein n=1 Tax=Psychrosphaera algicola TaxID=3023714 RepID=A0ABT5FBH0_9GAMM|nr:hypothetical protein [Psychrosphaera sp. G1-22]MDC2887962.1 hypothetical protein [Psychrosphaera sp. G1-22]